MSGGSYNYLCSRTATELLDRREDLESARDRLLGLGVEDVAQVLAEVIALAQGYRDSVDEKMARISRVLHELEWWDSCDHAEKDFRRAVHEYRAGTARRP